MSLHAISLEAQAALRSQQKKQFISSSIIGILIVALLMILLSLFLLTPSVKITPVLVSYSYQKAEEKQEKKVPKETVDKKPSPPSANINKVITSTAVSNIAVPVPDIEVETPSVDFGTSDDFGSGWGGSGSGGGSASFFNTKTKAQRVAYVIDYSASMRGKRDELMRAELGRSVSELSRNIEYQLIFFAGPAWVAGDKVQIVRNGVSKVTSKVGGGKEEVFEWSSSGGAHGFKPKEKTKRQQPKWLKATGSQLKESTQLVQETKLVWGTTWKPAIDMALSMEPKPDVVFFMTDGSCGGNIVQLAEDIGRDAKKKGVIINTVAMMQPQTEKAMRAMAENSGGTFTLIGPDGKPVRDKKD